MSLFRFIKAKTKPEKKKFPVISMPTKDDDHESESEVKQGIQEEANPRTRNMLFEITYGYDKTSYCNEVNGKYLPYIIGYKGSWMSIRNTTKEEVMEFLHISMLTEVDLNEGCKQYETSSSSFTTYLVFQYEEDQFLIVGNGLSLMTDDTIAFEKQVSKLKEAYLYMSYRTVDIYGMIIIKDGQIVRNLQLQEEDFINKGIPTNEEKDSQFAPDWEAYYEDFEHEDYARLDEEFIIEIAAAQNGYDKPEVTFQNVWIG